MPRDPQDMVLKVAPPIAEEPEQPFHVGLYEDGPAWNVTVAGISFPVTTSTFDAQGNEMRKAGIVTRLTRNQLKKVEEALQYLVVRWVHGIDRKTGKQKLIRAYIMDTRMLGFTRVRGDEPLAEWLYIRPFTEPAEKRRDASPSVLEAIRKALSDAQVSESKAQESPEDAATRERHGRARAAGSKLTDDAGI